MQILLTNDDGISSRGLQELAGVLSTFAHVTVVAPAFEQSGTGHGITVLQPLRLYKADMEGPESAWAVQGMPADCVKLALEHILPQKPDLVISGVNCGPNLATDVIYSGTVSGAMEGYIYGIPSIAISLIHDFDNLSLALDFVKRICLWWEKKQFLPAMILNINVPSGKIDGYRWAKLGFRTYDNAFEERVDPMGRQYFWLHGDVVDIGDHGQTDVDVVKENKISITPLKFDLTDYARLEDFADKPFI